MLGRNQSVTGEDKMMDERALNFDDDALQCLISARKILRKMNSKDENVKKLKELIYGAIDDINKAEATEEQKNGK